MKFRTRFITGSNSYLLSDELATKLTGRYMEFELFPLSFDEYLGMKAFYGKKTDTNLQKELNNYLPSFAVKNEKTDRILAV